MARKLFSAVLWAMMVSAAFAQSSTTVNAPTTAVRTQSTPQGTNTQVRAPTTTVSQTPAGAVVTAPGTTAVGDKQGTAVNAPYTTVRTNNQNGATTVSAPYTAVRAAPGGATNVATPWANVVVPSGRKMQQYTTVDAPTTAVRTNNLNGATTVSAPYAAVDVGAGGAANVATPWANVVTPGGRKMLRAK